jgi:hypothetical protein
VTSCITRPPSMPNRRSESKHVIRQKGESRFPKPTPCVSPATRSTQARRSC